MNTVTISTEDGTELSFALTDETDTSKAEGMLVGSTLVVTYTGTIDGTDTSAAVVTALEITAAPEAAGEPVEASSETASEAAGETSDAAGETASESAAA